MNRAPTISVRDTLLGIQSVESPVDPSFATPPALDVTAMTEQAPAAEGRTRVLTWVLHVALFAVGIALIVFYMKDAATAEALASLGRVGITTLGVAAVVYLASWALRSWRLHLLLRHVQSDVRPTFSVATATGANTLNLLAPARLGDVAAFLSIRNATASSGAAAALLVQWRLTDLGGLLLLGLAAAALLPWGSPAWIPSWVPWVVGGAALAAAAALALAWSTNRAAPTGEGGLGARFEQAQAFIAKRLLRGRLGDGASFARTGKLLLARRVLGGTLLLSLAAWAADAVVAGFLLYAAWPNPAAFAIVFVPVVVANAAKLLPSTPGAIGVFEGAFAATLIPYGVPFATALAVAVAVHLLMNLMTLVIGAPGAWSTLRNIPRAAWGA